MNQLDSTKQVQYFKGLDVLRFFAAALVVFHHSETIRTKNGFHSMEWLSFFRNGTNAVHFFFVLSGFLITYLLLKENHETKQTNVGTFYLKRILRIWPLYFLLISIGVFMLPVAFGILHIDYTLPFTIGETWYYFLFFMPGMVTILFGNYLLNPLWSIGVEEIFYLFWAPIFKIFKGKIKAVLYSVILIKLILLGFGIYILKDAVFNELVTMLAFEGMAIGGLGAYYFFNGIEFRDLGIFKRYYKFGIYSVLFCYLGFNENIHNNVWDFFFKNGFITKIVMDCFYGYVIIDVSIVSNYKLMQNKFLNYLGSISYGIYMYHMLCIFAIIQFLKKPLVGLNSTVSFFIFYTVVFTFVIGVSALSKGSFEQFFLSLKNKKFGFKIPSPIPANL